MIARLIVVAFLVLSGCSSSRSLSTGKDGHIPGISFSGGSGESFHDAIVINGARNKTDGVAAEYKYITDIHGQRGSGWSLVGQTVVREKNKIVDVVEIQLKSAMDRRIYYFDVSDFLGAKR